MKKFRVLLLTFVVAVTMMAGSLAVFAEDTAPAPTTGGTPIDTAGTVPISKTVQVAEGITFNETITVTATQTANADGVTAPEQVRPITGTIAVTQAAKTTPATGSLNFSSLTKPGEYTFIVTETAATTDSHGTWSVMDNQKYYLQVLVKADGSKQYAISKGENIVGKDSTDKTTVAAFENTYTKETTLVVTKRVVNPEYVDANTLYPFTITFTAPATGSLKADGYAVTNASNAFSDAEGTTALTTVKSGDTVYLKADGTFKVNGLPAGATYKLEEGTTTNVDSTTIAIVENDVAREAVVAGKIVDGAKLGEGTNSATVTNTYKQITVTGVIMNVLPFVMMIAIAGAAAAMYVVSRRRKMAR
jgi:hypothetical protein